MKKSIQQIKVKDLYWEKYTHKMMQPEDEPIGDIKEEDVFSNTDQVGYIGLKTELDLTQRKWFNEDMKSAGYDN